MKQKIKQFLFSFGFLKLFHSIRNRNTLTVLMLHRVLPSDIAQVQAADPEWTISPEHLDKIIVFAKQYYNVISLKQLENWQINKVKLPARALLLTFDDGWADNYDFALPILKKHQITAVIHQVSDCIDNNDFLWQEQLTSLATLDHARYEELSLKVVDTKISVNDLIKAIALDSHKVELLKTELALVYPQANTMMLSKQQLKQMISNGFELSSHGKTHRKLTTLPEDEVANELLYSREVLERLSDQSVTSISYPHGGYSEPIVKLSQEMGYRTLFTSTPVINELVASKKVFGRVHLSTALISKDGLFSAENMAYLLFNRRKMV